MFVQRTRSAYVRVRALQDVLPYGRFLCAGNAGKGDGKTCDNPQTHTVTQCGMRCAV